MKSILIVFVLTISYTITWAQQNYDASLIQKELLPYASAVIRDRDENIEVKSLDNTVYHVKEAITVLNKNGDDLAHIIIEHDKNNVIKYIKGVAYNGFGKQIGKFSESDFDDVSAGNDFSLFEDVRVKHYLPPITEYPYTIVYEYEERSKQSLNFDKWEPNSYPGVAVEKSLLTFNCPANFNIRYKEMNLPSKANINSNPAGLKTYSWQINDLKAVKYEPFSPYHENYLSSVQIAPENFTCYGISGMFNNWKELGKWEYDKLVAGRQELPAETIEHIKEITKDIPDPKLKAKKIYEYMQNKTHYISVQIGIGGYQPFLASDVDKQNYGDCKALVNYTQALLKAVNIESYYCVVEAGGTYKVNMLKEFASMEQGNHIILCIPFKNDTTWADCTSQTIPFGYLGSFTDDRIVLACTPEGGKLMHTPKYIFQDNLENRKANFIINEAGELSGVMNTTFKGTDYEDRDELINEPVKEQYKMLQKIYPINNLDILNLELKQDKSFNPVTTENIKLHARDYASLTEGKYYFMLNSANRRTDVPKQVINRLNDVYINRGYTEDDEIIFTIPAGYHLNKKPLNDVVDKPFAKFSAIMELKGNQLIYKRKLQVIDGTYSKDSYQDLVDFYQDVVDADSYTVVLVKNN
jgi:transglutaminase-like putative cysteine protease